VASGQIELAHGNVRVGLEQGPVAELTPVSPSTGGPSSSTSTPTGQSDQASARPSQLSWW